MFVHLQNDYLFLILIVTSNIVKADNLPVLQFLTDLVINVLHWRWLVIIDESHEEFNPILADHFLQQNISVTILTSNIESSIRNLLHRYDSIPALLLYSSKAEETMFLFDSCRIKWIVLIPYLLVETLLRESVHHLHRLHVVFAVYGQNDEVILQVPTKNMSDVTVINRWHPIQGFENSFIFGHCLAKPIKHMTIAMEKHFPFFKPGNSVQLAEGADVNLMDCLAASLNFKYKIKRPPDGSWGGKNGTEWTGMIGMLLRGEADAALSGMTMSFERLRVVQFSIPYAFDRTAFVTRRPAQRLKTWAIFWPYTAEVWISLAVSIILVAFLLTWLQTRIKSKKKTHLHFVDTLLYIFQSILNQGHYNAQEPRCRVLMSFWWIFCITVIAGYNGSLMSFMAHPGLSPSLDTVSELVEAVRQRDIAVGTIENSADYAMFKDSEEPNLKLILENMESDPRNLVHHDVDGLRETLRRNFAYVGGWVTVQADVWDPRLFLFSKDSFLQFGYAIAFSPTFEHVDIFNRKILQLRESGLIQKWIKGMIQKNQLLGNDDESAENDYDKVNEDFDVTSQSSLKIDDVQGAFAVLTIGLLFAITGCTFELYTAWRKRKRKAKIRTRLKKKKLLLKSHPYKEVLTYRKNKLIFFKFKRYLKRQTYRL